MVTVKIVENGCNHYYQCSRVDAEILIRMARYSYGVHCTVAEIL